MPNNNLNSEIMTHLSYNEFKELMQKKGEVSVCKTDKMMYTFYGMGEYKVCVEITIWLDEYHHIGKQDRITFSKLMTQTEAQCLYESIKKIKVVI